METRKFLLFEDNGVDAFLGQKHGGRGTARAAADNQHVSSHNGSNGIRMNLILGFKRP
jgi:hypothetical protein